MSESQIILPLFKTDAKQPAVDWMIAFLCGRDWTTASEMCQQIGVANTDGHRRSLRAAAEASEGRIAGGQRGYKLVAEMTKEEYNHFRNWMLSQTAKMEYRIVQSDRVFFGRQPIPA